MYTGLPSVTAPQNRPLGLLGLNADLLAAILDGLKRILHQVCAACAKRSAAHRTFLPSVYILANLKWITGYSSVLAFALAFPRKSHLEWIIFVLLLSFPLIGLAGSPFPRLEPLRQLPFLIGIPLLALYFWKRPRP